MGGRRQMNNGELHSFVLFTSYMGDQIKEDQIKLKHMRHLGNAYKGKFGPKT
jgi:hypothetical protein